MGEEQSSAFHYISWAIMVILFFFAFDLKDRIKARRYPMLIADENKRKLFDLVAIPTLMAIFMFSWGAALEWYYL